MRKALQKLTVQKNLSDFIGNDSIFFYFKLNKNIDFPFFRNRKVVQIFILMFFKLVVFWCFIFLMFGIKLIWSNFQQYDFVSCCFIEYCHFLIIKFTISHGIVWLTKDSSRIHFHKLLILMKNFLWKYNWWLLSSSFMTSIYNKKFITKSYLFKLCWNTHFVVDFYDYLLVK